jgi:hypothetical protein
MQSSRVDGLVERRVEGLVVGPGRSARQDLRGARPVELREILCRVLRQDGLTIGIGMMVRRAVAAPW